MSDEGYLADAATRHQVHVQRYAGGTLKKLAKFITKAISTAKERVADGLSLYGSKRYERQIQSLQGDLATIYGDMKGQAILDLTEFGGYEAEFNMTLLGKVVKTVVQLNTPVPAQIAAAALADPMDLEVGKGRQRISIAGALDEFGTKKSAEIISQIRVGSALGETSDQIARRLTPLGVKQKDQAAALVNTMTNHIASTARVEVLKDEYAREIPGSTRPSVGPDGVEQVSSKTSYGEWLARQPASFQRDVLGPARYELFSKGGLTIDRFVDDNGKTLTLKELREREPMAFERVENP